jgi:peroxiredoxin
MAATMEGGRHKSERSAPLSAEARHTSYRNRYAGKFGATMSGLHTRVLSAHEARLMTAASPNPSNARSGAIRRIGVAVVVVAIAVAGYFAFFGSQQRVPDATFTLLSGQKVSTADLKGKVYLINFWATSCSTCMQEMPQMIQTYNRFKGEGLEFVAVAMNYDAPMYVANYAQTRQLPFKVAMDDGSAAKQFGNVQLTPTTFVIGRDGKIIKRYVGEPQFAELDQLLQKALST